MQNSTKYDEDLYNARCQLIYVLRQLNTSITDVYRKPEQPKNNSSDDYSKAYTSGYKSGYDAAHTESDLDTNEKISFILDILLWIFFLLLILFL